MISGPSFQSVPSQGPFQGTIQLISRCPLCNAVYQPSATRILVEQNDAHLIHLECGMCQGGVVAVIITNLLGVHSVGLVTDLTPEDVLRFRTASPVGSDDIIDLHTALAEQQGTLTL